MRCHLPGSVLGVLGGGQLGRMFVHAAQAMGYATAVLDPDPASPAGLIAHHHIRTGYTDTVGLTEMAQRCAAVTTEFENVPASSMETLGQSLPVRPAAQAVAVAQDRILEKAQLCACGVPVAPYVVVQSTDDLTAIEDALFPGILKTARLGYDGKGQVRVMHSSQLARAWESLGRVPCVFEKALPLDFECSVLVARGSDGCCVHYWPQRNVHDGGILAVTRAYFGNMDAAIAHQVIALTETIATKMNYVGVLCVEYFVLQAGTPEHALLGAVVANEMAPRPHNSGHYTIDACDVSQFALQVRTLAGLPLVQPRQHSAAVMLNLLGDLWPGVTSPQGAQAGAAASEAGETGSPPWDKVLALPGAHLHLYGKPQPRPGRKMGHLTLTAPTADQANATALDAVHLLGLREF
ncbi:5-(carboxyamino)imidazole ribonucleotide synthase [Candidatus Symbiobacter mobilis CR]|uniref:N5-carboxyaminoimidazole ribonucleotide synthase n=2 Tax=Candidatus Symbiobacter TaxID=1436289 RepID=U5N8B2_9BURK|nr:5-(carboxyamino)imidazole ribonucleotide synthase [Candidatus Symbiobacter mobilis CR]